MDLIFSSKAAKEVSMKCPHCNELVPAKAQFCSQCGQPLDLPSRRGRQQAAISRSLPSAKEGSDDERELWRGTFSAKGMINYWVVACLATVVLPFVGMQSQLDRVGWLVLVALIGILWAGLLLVLGFHKLDVRYELTSQRLIHRSGILTRHWHRIEVIDIDDVSCRQGIIERIFGVGTITILSSDESDPELDLPGIDHVHHVAALIDDARRVERVRRGIHIETV